MIGCEAAVRRSSVQIVAMRRASSAWAHASDSAAWQDAENGSENGSANDGRSGIDQVFPCGHQSGDFFLYQLAVHFRAGVGLAVDQAVGGAAAHHHHQFRLEVILAVVIALLFWNT